MGKFKKWNCLLCKELCDHFERFEENPNKADLCVIKEITEIITNLEEMELSGAMRTYAEEKLGYDSHTGMFAMDKDGEWDEYDLGIYDAMDRRRRDSRGRFMRAAAMPPYYPDGWSTMPYAEHDKGMSRRTSDDMGHRGDGMMNDGKEMYRVRQDNGRPMMERMYAMGGKEMKPKKLTKEQYEEWMKNLENDDGTRGAHFSKQQTDEMAKKLGVDFSDFSKEAWELAVNMMYSDYCDTIGKHVQGHDIYGKLAKDFLEDEDASKDGEEKLAAYYHSIVE